MKQVHIYISGFVQGVGFRDYISNHANRLGIKGWVKNTSDGKVEAVFQGFEEDINHILEFCHRGPFTAEIEEVEVNWQEVDEIFEDFKIER